MTNRVPLNVRVDEDVQDQFREFTRESKGKVRGEMGRLVEKALKEYMDNDRHTRLSHDHEQILQYLEELVDRQISEDAHTHTDQSGMFQDLNPQVRDGILGTVNNLEKGQLDSSDIKQAVYNAGKTDKRTIEKYRDILISRGVLLPNPLESTDKDSWVHGDKQFSIICEHNDDLTPEFVIDLLDELENDQRLSRQEYREVLPDDYIENQELKIDQEERTKYQT